MIAYCERSLVDHLGRFCLFLLIQKESVVCQCWRCFIGIIQTGWLYAHDTSTKRWIVVCIF